MTRARRHQPVLIIGMHRSGTSMVARALERLGLFTGRRKQADHESVFFLALNDWMLLQSGGSWERPAAIRDLLENEEVMELVTDYLRTSLGSPRAISYLGLRRYLRVRAVDALREPWGWKDPRTTFTLPAWLRLFPEAKVVHVLRHGVDVAASLAERHRRVLAQRRTRYWKTRPQYLLRAKRSGFSTTLRTTSLENGLALWEEYVLEGRRHLAERGERGLEVQYETFAADPTGSLERIADFCGIPAPGALTREIGGALRSGRAYAHRRSQDLASFADLHAERLRAHGY